MISSRNCTSADPITTGSQPRCSTSAADRLSQYR
jgi:hypothetical protein